MVVALAAGYAARDEIRAALTPARIALMGPATVEDRVAEHGIAARSRLAPYFESAGVPYPPERLVLAGFKQEKVLELYASDGSGGLRFIRSYPVLAESGQLGPKLAEGDRQVPEGLYRIESLNPNSRFHLSLRMDYPNQFDRARAEEEGRRELGGDIMIHGAAASVGCLAIGNPGIEELFVLVPDVGRQNVSVVLSPVDLRRSSLPSGLVPSRPWVAGLYEEVRAALSALPLPRG